MTEEQIVEMDKWRILLRYTRVHFAVIGIRL